MAEDLQYSVGKFTRYAKPLKEPQRQALMESLGVAQANLWATAAKLTEAQLNTPYRSDGWTARQVVHHIVHISLCQQ